MFLQSAQGERGLVLIADEELHLAALLVPAENLVQHVEHLFPVRESGPALLLEPLLERHSAMPCCHA